MRVVLFPSAYAPAVGGVEELTFQLARQLIQMGDTVEVWTHRHPHDLARQEVIDGIQVRRFELPMPAADLAVLARLPVRMGRALADLRRSVRSFRPDVIHVQCFSANGAYAAALSKLTGTPLVVSLQGETVMDDRDIYDRSVSLRAGLRMGLRRARAVTACSRFVLDDAEARFGLKSGLGSVVPNGVDTDSNARARPLVLPFERFVFAVGRFVGKKGFDLLLEAYASVAHEHPDVGLVIGGDGSARALLAARVGELGLGGRVVLPGALSRREVAWGMQNAATFVLPSRVEPFGIVVVEALHAGCPVIVSNRGGAGEIVRDEQDGLTVDPLDSGALGDALSRLLGDRELRERLSAAGPERARDFRWSGIAQRYQQLYRGAV